MNLIDRQHAANLMGVPITWVDVMIELGALSSHEGCFGEVLVDEDEINEKGFIDPKQKAVSLEHLQSMLRKLGIVHRPLP